MLVYNGLLALVKVSLTTKFFHEFIDISLNKHQNKMREKGI